MSFKELLNAWDLQQYISSFEVQSLITPTDSGYQSLSENLVEYEKYDCIPFHLRFDNKLQTFVENKVKYHKTCRTRYNSQKITRLKEKLNDATQLASSSASTSERNITRSKYLKCSVKTKCIFCDQQEEGKEKDIHRYAVLVQDEMLLKNLHSTDLVAMEAKYHKSCYIKLLNKVRSIRSQQLAPESEVSVQTSYGSTLSELVTHIQETYLYSAEAPVFRLANLTAMFKERLQEQGIENFEVHRTKLKQHLLELIPGLREDKVGREVLLSFEDDVRNAVEIACQNSAMSDGMCLARAAKILRQQMFNEYPKFNGSFQDSFTGENCVPNQCILFCRMLLLGGAFTENLEIRKESQRDINLVATNIAQLIRFNCKKKVTQTTTSQRHSLDRETPLPLYIGIKLYNDNVRKEVFDNMCDLGLSVSYKRVVEVSEMVSSNACDLYKEQGFVCPKNIQQNVFTCAAIDNMDHNTSSNTSIDSFHGTTISVILHPEHFSNATPSLKLTKKDNYEISLPDSYTNILPTPKKQSDVPMQTVNYNFGDCRAISPTAELKEWLDHTKIAVENHGETLTWAAYHSRKENPENIKIKCQSVILPILRESINSHAMVRHTMNIIMTITNKNNPGQKPVITADQPIYAIAKQIQWSYPEMYGEDKLVVMLGPLHIEMAVISMIGTWLEDSGWTDNLVEAGITTPGRAEGILKSSHVKRSRYAHEVTITALNVLLEEAFMRYKEAEQSESFMEWMELNKLKSAQFQFWCTAMDLESLLLLMVRSIRQGDIAGFLDSLHSICPWMFSLDHVNYARWLPIFVHDLEKLPTSHPEIYKEFQKGNFTSLKTNRNFSRIGHDQMHEQNNKLVKLDSRTLTNLSNDNMLLKWAVSGPEMARMTTEFEEMYFCYRNYHDSTRHHEDSKAFTLRFQKHVNDLVNVFKEHGNPFEDDDLTTVNSSRLVMSESSQTSVTLAASKGKKQYAEYVIDRLQLRSKSIHAVIKRNNLPLFNSKKATVKSKVKQKIGELREDSNLFCKLYVASQGRDGNVDDFFSHENHSYAPSISEFGKLRKPTNKSDIVTCIEQSSKHDTPILSPPEASCLIIDGAALVHMLTPKTNQTFQQYIDGVLVPHFKGKLRKFDRVDIVFDVYIENSLKSDTRESRGSGQLIAVKETTKIPRNFQKFLANNKNKEQLFILIARTVVKIQEAGKTVISTCKDKVSSSSSTEMSSSSHEEADARLLLHADDAARNGHSRILVKTVDSDVLVIALFAFSKIPNLQELWIEFGTGKHLKYLPVHTFVAQLPSGMPDLMPLFHSLTGCDTVSAFCGIGKKSAWKTWNAFREVDVAFQAYSRGMEPCQNSSEIALIETFVVHMYHPTSNTNNVNTARRVLFTKKNRTIENIPPTQDALLQHIKRAIYQTQIWTNCLNSNPEQLDPCNWGWQKKNDGPAYTPLWKTLPDASHSCKELLSCKCKERCTRCRCVKNGLNCTLLCACEGACSRQNV